MAEQIYIMCGHIASDDEMQQTMRLPKFRKATRAMGYTYAGVQRILSDIPALLEPEYADRIGVVVGSSHGELDVTTQFLDAIGKQNVARPILFQNSLHNSTLGFLTVELQYTGPAITISNGQASGEDAIDTAMLLLESGDCDLCFAIGYDLWVPAVESVRDRFYPEGLVRGEGAGVILLANEAGRSLLRGLKPPLASIEGLHSQRNPGSAAALTAIEQPFYDASGVAEVVAFLNQPESGDEHISAKPNGTIARLKVRRL